MSNEQMVMISPSEYNYMMNHIAALEEALEAQLTANQAYDGFFGNTYIYLVDGGGVDGWLTDEDHHRIPDQDYAAQLAR